MIRIRRKILRVCVGLAVVLILLEFHYKQRDTYKCETCHSKQHFYQWRFGSWTNGSFPVSRKSQTIDETQLRQQLFASDHEHEWVYFQGSPYKYFGTTWSGCGLGGAKHMNEFAQWYELNSDFRTFIQTKIDSAGLCKESLREIAGIPSWHYTPVPSGADESELIVLAKSLLHEQELLHSSE